MPARADRICDAAVLVTLHGKARAIGPVLERFLGLTLVSTPAVDTDAFGSKC